MDICQLPMFYNLSSFVERKGKALMLVAFWAWLGSPEVKTQTEKKQSYTTKTFNMEIL
jgi:hypothetical protein